LSAAAAADVLHLERQSYCQQDGTPLLLRLSPLLLLLPQPLLR
jgi:hypothetical protein